MRLVGFMQGASGRFARGTLGAVLVGVGAWLGATYGGGWWALFAIGFVPLAAAVFDLCLVAPLFGAPVHHAHEGA